MKISWQSDTDRLVCRWFEIGKRIQYNPRWIQDASQNADQENASLLDMDFAWLSRFGGSEWYAYFQHRPR